MTTVRQLLEGKGSEVASIAPDKSVYDAMQLDGCTRTSAHCWCLTGWEIGGYLHGKRLFAQGVLAG